MARYTGPSCRLCRREGTKLFLKGDRCLTSKCAVDRRGSAPGQHGAAPKKLKEYGLQPRERKAKRYYGVLERQFRNYFHKAVKTEALMAPTCFHCLNAVSTTSFTEWAWPNPARKRDSSFFTPISALTVKR